MGREHGDPEFELGGMAPRRRSQGSAGRAGAEREVPPRTAAFVCQAAVTALVAAGAVMAMAPTPSAALVSPRPVATQAATEIGEPPRP